MFAATLDWFIEDVFRLPVQKALDPNDPHDFAIITAQLAKATKGLAQPEEAKALKQALAMLDVDWKNMSGDAKAKVVQAAKAAVNPVKTVLPKVEDKFEADAAKLGMQTKASNKKTFGFAIGVSLTDVQQKSLQAIAFSQGNYVRDEYGKRSDAFGLKAKQIVAEEVAKGSTQKEISKRLNVELTAQQFNRSQSYWDIIAGAFANRARTYTNLSSYQEVGIQRFRFESVRDQRTSQICRFMHGREFPVESALKAYARSEAKGGDVKEEQPWAGQANDADGNPVIYVNSGGSRVPLATVTESAAGKVDESGKFSGGASNAQLEKLGVMTPPLHGHCRSTIVPAGTSTVAVPTAPPLFQLTPPTAAPPPPTAAPPPPPAAPAEQTGLPFGPGGISNVPAMLFPEQQGFAFGPGGISMKPIAVPTLDPAAPPVKAYVPLHEKKDAALEKLAALKPNANGLVPTPMTVKQNDKFDKAKDQIVEAFADGYGKKTPPKFISGMKATKAKVDPAKVEEFIKNPKLLIKEEIQLVKIGKELYVVHGHEALAAAHLLDKWKMPAKEISLKEFEAFMAEKAKAAAAKPAAPPIPPKPVPTPTPLPPPPPTPLKQAIDPAAIMHEKTNRPGGGSNQGAFYRGKDGVERFVKLYQDPGQAHGEVLANSLYKALGFESPEAVTWKDVSGKQGYASTLVEGKQLGSGATKAQAREFFKGFAADVLSANWDAAGQSVDNAFLTKGGKVVRIDNGGAFLMRAQGGRKPAAVLNSVSELDYFFPGSGKSNPGYHALAKAAGYNSVEDFKDEFKGQVAKISQVRQQYGGWSNFVAQYAPGLADPDRAQVVKMLEERNRLLEKKVAELYAPAPPPPTPGSIEGKRLPSINGAKPSDKLRLADLPETPRPKDAPVGKMPWGEDRAAYRKRMEASLAKISETNKSGVVAFTGSSYGAIRESEMRGTPDANAQKIKRAFQQGTAEACTVMRAIQVPESVAEGMIRNGGVFRLGQGNKGATASTTWDPAVGMEWAGGTYDGGDVKIKFMIHQKSGLPIEAISRFRHEHEILLHADAEFRVVGSARLQGKKRVIIIELEEI